MVHVVTNGLHVTQNTYLSVHRPKEMYNGEWHQFPQPHQTKYNDRDPCLYAVLLFVGPNVERAAGMKKETTCE